MLAQERQTQILQFLGEQGTVRTVDLAGKFNCTDETIRRDLQILSDQNLLTRVHGGASSLNGRPILQSFAQRRSLNVDKKKAIANAALSLIEPGQTYAFDSSTTAFELVCILPDLPYRVVTNAFAVLEHVAHMENIELISTGGRYHPKTQTFSRNESYQTLKQHNINRAFVSCIGLDFKRGASEGFEAQASFKETLVQLANSVVLMVDSTKLDKRSEYFFAEIKSIDHIITDDNASPSSIRRLERLDCKITIAH